jgi:hypothetical protein
VVVDGEIVGVLAVASAMTGAEDCCIAELAANRAERSMPDNGQRR